MVKADKRKEGLGLIIEIKQLLKKLQELELRHRGEINSVPDATTDITVAIGCLEDAQRSLAESKKKFDKEPRVHCDIVLTEDEED